MAFDVAPLVDELLAPLERKLSPEIARLFADWELSPETEARMDDLGDKANDGKLTSEEDAELRAFILLCERLSILKLKSELLLRQSGSAA